MAELLDFVQDKENNEFYPTPDALIRRMIDKVNWKTVETVLEPSAGKGDILKAVARHIRHIDRERSITDIDAIEIDPNLRSILKHNFSKEAEYALRDRRKRITDKRSHHSEKEWNTHKYRYFDSSDNQYHYYPDDEQAELTSIDFEQEGFFTEGIHVVHNDFLTYTNYKKYNLIIMNPPFSKGDRHLLKAIEMQESGGQIVCLLNAETIRNPFCMTRSSLVHKLEKYGAEIEYIKDAFVNAERRTGVEVALIYINIPFKTHKKSIYERMAKAREYEEPTAEQAMELEVTDFVQMVVNRYKVEVESGIELIRTYERMKPYLSSEINPEKGSVYNYSLINLCDDNNREMTINKYVRKVRYKYWKALLSNTKFVGRLTSKLQREYSERISEYADYDFSEFNIHTLRTEMNAQIKSGIESEIETMYDRLTMEHSYYSECSKNRYLYDGWKTNKAWKLDKKSILPCYGVFDSWSGKPRAYEAVSALADIERVLNFFDGSMTADVNLADTLERSFNSGITKNIQCKFFTLTFYKKGTVHITYTCPELIDRYNIYCAQNRKWLPPSYGKKKYADMTAEEQAVIDSFQGEQAYSKVMSKPDYYLAPLVTDTDVLLLDVNNDAEQRTA
jgi:hypothetical protein